MACMEMQEVRTSFELFGGITSVALMESSLLLVSAVPNHSRRETRTDKCILTLILDSSDRDRLTEASDELQKLMKEEELRGAALLVLANKNVRSSISLVTQQLHL